jgi:hypothetical protein
MLLRPEREKHRQSYAVHYAILGAGVLVLIISIAGYRNVRQDAFDTGMDAYEKRAWCRAAQSFERLFALNGAERLKARARATYDESQFMCELEASGFVYPGEEAERVMRFLIKNPKSRFRSLAYKKWLGALDITARPPTTLAELERSLRPLATCSHLTESSHGSPLLDERDGSSRFYEGILALRAEDPVMFRSITLRAQELYLKAIQWLSSDTGAVGQTVLHDLARAACDQKPSPAWLASALSVTGKGKLAFLWQTPDGEESNSFTDWYSYQRPAFAQLQARSLEEVRFVACVKQRSITLEVCHYASCSCSGTWYSSYGTDCEVHREAKVFDVSLHDPMGGTMVARHRFRGVPRKCRDKESFVSVLCEAGRMREAIEDEPSWKSVADWFSRLPR